MTFLAASFLVYAYLLGRRHGRFFAKLQSINVGWSTKFGAAIEAAGIEHIEFARGFNEVESKEILRENLENVGAVTFHVSTPSIHICGVVLRALNCFYFDLHLRWPKLLYWISKVVRYSLNYPIHILSVAFGYSDFRISGGKWLRANRDPFAIIC
jgi:hypothetical protein